MHIKSFSLFILCLISISVFAFHPDKKANESSGDIEVTILQLNLWVECTKVEKAHQYLTEQIAYLQPDIATFCELYKGEKDDPVIPKLINELKKQGLSYYSAQIDGRAIISVYPIIEKEKINEWMFKAVLDIYGKRVAVYPSHSEYRYYTCYYPRGYNDGSVNWNKLSTPITDVKEILSKNRKSGRIESAQAFIKSAKKEIAKGALVFFAGDLNEPSHLDWQKNTKKIRDHHGCVVNWDTSKLLYKNGFKDAYRKFHPDAVDYPGFTFPADNKNVNTDVLTWADDADERERIDFIYYYPRKDLHLKSAKIAGPSGSIIRSKRVEENSKDVFVSSNKSHWPSDHKGVLITFILKR
jgi:exonuclease III